MKKPKRQKPRPPRAAAPLPPQKPIPVSRLRSFLQSIADHPIGPILGAVASLVAIFGGVIPALYGPEISVSGSDPTSPFELPFLVTNKSWILPMQDVTWECAFHRAEMLNGSTFEGISLLQVSDEDHREIAPNATHQQACRLINPGVGFRSIRMDVAVRFITLGFWHREDVRPFTWISSGEHSQWVPGS